MNHFVINLVIHEVNDNKGSLGWSRGKNESEDVIWLTTGRRHLMPCLLIIILLSRKNLMVRKIKGEGNLGAYIFNSLKYLTYIFIWYKGKWKSRIILNVTFSSH